MEEQPLQIEGIHIPKIIDTSTYDIDDNSYVQVKLCYFKRQNYYEVSLHKGSEEKILAKVDTVNGVVNVACNNGKILIYCSVWDFDKCDYIPTKVLYLYDIEDDTFHVMKETEALALMAPSLNTEHLDEHRLTYNSVSPYGLEQRAKSMPKKPINTTQDSPETIKSTNPQGYIKLLK